jgi:hypothetical protein
MSVSPRLVALVSAVSLLTLLGLGCGGSSQIQQPETTPYMRSQVGTPNELSPLAPPGASNLRKVKGQWLCDVNGRAMVFNPVSSNWEPKR